MSELSIEKRRDVLNRLLNGESVRNVATAVGCSKVTVTRYSAIISAAELFGDDFRLPKCACGQSSGNRGWCSVRFAKSERRQKFMSEWRKK